MAGNQNDMIFNVSADTSTATRNLDALLSKIRSVDEAFKTVERAAHRAPATAATQKTAQSIAQDASTGATAILNTEKDIIARENKRLIEVAKSIASDPRGFSKGLTTQFGDLTKGLEETKKMFAATMNRVIDDFQSEARLAAKYMESYLTYNKQKLINPQKYAMVPPDLSVLQKRVQTEYLRSGGVVGNIGDRFVMGDEALSPATRPKYQQTFQAVKGAFDKYKNRASILAAIEEKRAVGGQAAGEAADLEALMASKIFGRYEKYGTSGKLTQTNMLRILFGKSKASETSDLRRDFARELGGITKGTGSSSGFGGGFGGGVSMSPMDMGPTNQILNRIAANTYSTSIQLKRGLNIASVTKGTASGTLGGEVQTAVQMGTVKAASQLGGGIHQKSGMAVSGRVGSSGFKPEDYSEFLTKEEAQFAMSYRKGASKQGIPSWEQEKTMMAWPMFTKPILGKQGGEVTQVGESFDKQKYRYMMRGLPGVESTIESQRYNEQYASAIQQSREMEAADKLVKSSRLARAQELRAQRKEEEAIEKAQGQKAIIDLSLRKKNLSASLGLPNANIMLGDQSYGMMQRVLRTPSGSIIGANAPYAENRRFDDARYNKRGSEIMASMKRNRDGEPVIENALSRGLIWAGVSAGIYGAVGAAQKFIQTMITMDKQVADLRKTLVGSEKDFSGLIDGAIRIARTYKTGTQDVLDAMEIFSKQFKNSSDLQALSKSTAIFSNISGQSIKDSAETMTATLQQYNMSVSDAAKITDSWANVSANSAVTIKDLGEAVSTVGAVAQTAGVKFDELNGMIAAVSAASGKSGAEIGNAFKRMFERATSPENAKKLIDISKKAGFGLEFSPFNQKGENRNFMDILTSIQNRWDKLNTTQQKNIAISMVGARQYDVFVTLMRNWNNVLSMTETSLNSVGAAEKQNERIGDTFVKKAQQLGVEFDNLARSAGGKFLPVLGTVVDMMGKAIRLFNEAPSSIKAMASALALIGGGKIAAGFLMDRFGSRMDESGKRILRSGSKISNVLTDNGKYWDTETESIQWGRAASGRLKQLGAAGTRKYAMTTGGIAGELGPAGLGTATTVAGLTTLGVALAALASVTWAVYRAFTEFKNKSKDILDEMSKKSEESRSTQMKLGQFSGTLSGAYEKYKTSKTGQEKEDAKNSLESAIKTEMNNPQSPVYSSLNKRFLVNYSGKLDTTSGSFASNIESVLSETKEQQKAIAFERAKRAASNVSLVAQEKAFSKAFNTSVGGSILEYGSKRTGAGQLIDTQLGQKGLTDFFNNLQSQRQLGNEVTSKTTAELYKTMKGGQIDKSTAKEFADRFNEFYNYKLQKTQDINDEIAKRISNEKGPVSDKRKQEISKKVYGEFQGGLINVTNESGVRDFLRELMQPQNKRLREPGGEGGGGAGKIRYKYNQTDVPRIDLELQQSLVYNELRNKANAGGFFGGGGRLRGMQSAYATAAEKNRSAREEAWGPEEERALIKKQERVNLLKTEYSKQTELGKESQNTWMIDGKKEKITQQLVENAERELELEKKKKYLIKENSEAVQDMLDNQKNYLEMLSDMQDSMKSPIQGALTNSLMSVYGSDPVAQGQKDADMRYLQAQYDRAVQIQNKNGTSNTASGRNELKHITDQMKKMNYEQERLNEKTNVWKNMLQGIGNNMMQKLTGKVTDMITENVMGMATSGLESVFGASPATGSVEEQQLSVLKQIALNTSETTTLTHDQIKTTSDQAQASAKAQGEAIKSSAEMTGRQMAGAALSSAIIGAGIGAAMTSAQGKTGNKGTIGGALGGAAGAVVGGAYGGSAGATVGGSLGSVLGGLIGAAFDDPIKALEQTLDEVDDSVTKLTSAIEKNTNTINDVMENLINAPSNFVLPIAKGIMENSITAQSALATPLQAGGYILKSGTAFVHAGETISSANGSNSGGNSGVNVGGITIHSSTGNAEEIANEVINKINKVYSYQGQRSGNYVKRF